jgi:hypothetical protein
MWGRLSSLPVLRTFKSGPGATGRPPPRVSTFSSRKRRPERLLVVSPELNSMTTLASAPVKPWVLVLQGSRPERPTETQFGVFSLRAPELFQSSRPQRRQLESRPTWQTRMSAPHQRHSPRRCPTSEFRPSRVVPFSRDPCKRACVRHPKRVLLPASPHSLHS